MLPIPVFRVEKNANYTTMSNYHLRDNTISFKAKGILSMFLSLPKNWNYSVSGLAAISKEGKDGILSGLKELEAAGYLERHRYRNERGRLGDSEYVIYEIPPTADQFRLLQNRVCLNWKSLLWRNQFWIIQCRIFLCGRSLCRVLLCRKNLRRKSPHKEIQNKKGQI